MKRLWKDLAKMQKVSPALLFIAAGIALALVALAG